MSEEAEEVEVTEQDMVGCRFGRGITYYYQVVGNLNFTLEASLNTGASSGTVNVFGMALTFTPAAWAMLEIGEGTETNAWLFSAMIAASNDSLGELLDAKAHVQRIDGGMTRVKSEITRLKAQLDENETGITRLETFAADANA